MLKKKTINILPTGGRIIPSLAIVAIILIGIIGGVTWFYTKHPSQKTTITISAYPILRIDGYVRHPLNLSLEEIVAMPKSTVYAELYW